MATVTTEAEPKQDMEVEEDFPTHIITLDRYRKMIEAGVYLPHEPVFLGKGRLVEKMGKNNPHIFSTSVLFHILVRLLPEGWAVRSEQPIALGGNSMPELDLTILRGSLRDYRQRSARGNQDVMTVIEVSDSSLRIDSPAVLRAYATEGIPVYWIINIPNARIEVYSRPTGPSETPTYQERLEYGPDDEIPIVLDGLEVGRIAVREILP